MKGVRSWSDVRSVIWQRLDPPAMEYCALARTPTGWALQGRVVFAEDSGPAFYRYRIACDARWLTRSASVEVRRGYASTMLTLRADDERRWWTGDVEIAGVRGCVDVDLGFTPATNTIAIRRLALDVGRAESLTAAWVRPTSLEIRPLAQRYTRISQTVYDYESERFSTRVEVDEDGLVTSYPPFWSRVSTGGSEVR